MKVINFFGCPGAGKSTTAAALFAFMKNKGLNVELVTEYFKELVWENTAKKTTDYLYVLANQNRRLERLRDKVDYIVTDCPLLLVGFYATKYGKHIDIVSNLSRDMYNTYDNINFLISAPKEISSSGRIHSLEESLQLGQEMMAYLIDNWQVGADICLINNDKNIINNCLKHIL